MRHELLREGRKGIPRSPAFSCYLIVLPIAAYQAVGRAIVLELCFLAALQFGNYPFGEHLAKSHPPLIERIAMPQMAPWARN